MTRACAAAALVALVAGLAAPPAESHGPRGHAPEQKQETPGTEATGPQAKGLEAPAATRAPEPEPPGHHRRHRELQGAAKLVAYLGNFHPALVNFPIALVVVAALAEALRAATGRASFGDAARYCVWLGAASAVPAAALGWCFAGFDPGSDDWILGVHRWLGTLTAGWSVAILALLEFGKATPYRAALLAGAALVSTTGFFGGALVYGIDHYAW